MTQPSTCVLCDKMPTAIGIVPNRPGMWELKCPRCGTYRISDSVRPEVETGATRDRRYLLSGLCRNASENGGTVEILSHNLKQLLEQAARPRTMLDAMDAVMRTIMRHVVGVEGVVTFQEDHDYSLFYLQNTYQLTKVFRALHDQGYITTSRLNLKEVSVELTVAGWHRALELSRTGVDADQAFIAMSFSENLLPLYHEGIKPALIATGYDPFRVDQTPHNDKIDHRIVAEIRRSGLLIADFTGQRQGVYYEAGLAEGLGIPVIRCCRRDEIEKVHFDTRQYYHIAWDNSAELRTELEAHIRATIAGRATRQAKTSQPVREEEIG